MTKRDRTEGGEEILADERAHRPVEGSTRGPCGPKKTLTYQLQRHFILRLYALISAVKIKTNGIV